LVNENARRQLTKGKKNKDKDDEWKPSSIRNEKQSTEKQEPRKGKNQIRKGGKSQNENQSTAKQEEVEQQIEYPQQMLKVANYFYVFSIEDLLKGSGRKFVVQDEPKSVIC